MLTFIRGKLVSSSPTYAIVDVQGIGYKIFIAPSTFSKLPQTDSTVLLHTSFVIREYSQALYGFLNSEEKDLFEALMNVTGIGPKIALSIIGHMDIYELSKAISSHDTVSISKVPGIGKKTAERLIIEMRDKVQHIIPQSTDDGFHGMKLDHKSQTINDAMSALINLGYNQNTAQKAIKKTLKDIPEGIDLASLITLALKHVG